MTKTALQLFSENTFDVEKPATTNRSKMGLAMKSWGKPLGIIDPDNTAVWKEQRR